MDVISKFLPLEAQDRETFHNRETLCLHFFRDGTRLAFHFSSAARAILEKSSCLPVNFVSMWNQVLLLLRKLNLDFGCQEKFKGINLVLGPMELDLLPLKVSCGTVYFSSRRPIFICRFHL